MTGRTEIAQLKHRLALVDEYIVGLDVGVQQITALEQLEREKELLRVGLNGLDVQTNSVAVAFQQLTQVHIKRFGDETQVAFVLEGAVKTQAVVLVVSVHVVQLAQVFKLLQA